MVQAMQSEPSSMFDGGGEENGGGKLLVVVIIYMTTLFLATHWDLQGTALDAENRPTEFAPVEMLFHFGAYAVLVFLFLHAVLDHSIDGDRSARHASARKMVLVSVLVLIFGVIDETTQPYFGRRLEGYDLLANFFGIVAGQLGFLVFEASGWRRSWPVWTS